MNIGALIIKNRVLYYNVVRIRTPQNGIGNSLGPCVKRTTPKPTRPLGDGPSRSAKPEGPVGAQQTTVGGRN